jgi:metallo-beta-lactamase family protein
LIELGFHGAAGTVTGSRYVLRSRDAQILVDCGLFQGYKHLRLRNRAAFPVPPNGIDAVVLTHAHIDHTGYLPAFVRDGYDGAIIGTAATCDLAAILLRDSAHLQEEEAAQANRHGWTKHKPALPLYTAFDAERAIAHLESRDFGVPFSAAGFSHTFRHAGHILGAASLTVERDGVTVAFSGDLGRTHDPLLPAPVKVAHADYVVLESTYGDRTHPRDDVQSALGEIVRRTSARGGAVIIPSFAVGRAQSVLYHLHALRTRGDIPHLPIFIDSPMAGSVTRLMHTHAADHLLSAEQCREVFDAATITNSVQESKAIDRRNGPMIIISASGMMTGGRVLYHVERFGGDHRNTILLVGHQAGGTRGEALLRGARQLRIHGRHVPIHAEVAMLPGLSAHADADELMSWLRGFESAPRRVFLTHGEPPAADALRLRIEEELGWPVTVPEHNDVVRLEG